MYITVVKLWILYILQRFIYTYIQDGPNIRRNCGYSRSKEVWTEISRRVELWQSEFNHTGEGGQTLDTTNPRQTNTRHLKP